MASGLIGVLNGAASLSYTPASLARVRVVASANLAQGGYVTINGVNIYEEAAYGSNLGQFSTIEMFIAPGQILTVATTGQNTAIVSSIEEGD